MTNQLKKALENGTTLESCPCKQFQKKYTCDHVVELRRFKEENKNTLILVRAALDPNTDTSLFLVGIDALKELGIKRTHLNMMFPSKYQSRHNPSSRPASNGPRLPYFIEQGNTNA